MSNKLNNSMNGVAEAAPYNSDEILQYAIENGILNLPNIEEQIKMNIRNKYLDMHNHKIWQGIDGRWCTYVPDPSNPKGLKFCKRKSRSDLEDIII